MSIDADLRTVRDYLRYATSRFAEAKLVFGHGTATAFDEAAFIVLEGLHLPVDRLEPFLDAHLTRPECERLSSLIDARVATRKPAPYLLNRAYVQGVGFYVDERVIVPRSYIGELLAGEFFNGDSDALIADPREIGAVLDLCTGSGCLAILAAMAFPNALVDGVDLSSPALDVARQNVAEQGLAGRIDLLEGDLFAPLGGRRYDLIVTNPPHVSAAEMRVLPPEYLHEPYMALASGEDGLDIVRRIIAGAGAYLNEGGGLLCEIGTGRDILAVDYPDLDFLWLDTADSEGEVFWLRAADLTSTGV
jgi:ribosomal protein L3 glutamine methyltransferase